MEIHLQNGHILLLALGLCVVLCAVAAFIVAEALRKWRLSRWAHVSVDRLHARLGEISMKYIDRANDVAPESGDPAERILSEWAAETNAALDLEWPQL